MKLYHFQKTLDFFSSRLIFANLENQAPIAAEKVENQEKPGEKQKTPEQKEGQIMKEYKILENRLEKGKQKLEACRKILETIPKGEHLDRAKNLYQEAEKLLNGIGQDLPKLEAKKGEELMSELSTNVEEGIEAASDKAFSLKADVLMKAGINIGESASDENKALLAIDLPLITQSAEKIRRLGVTSDQLGPLLNMAARNNKERGLQEMTHYIEAAKNPNITAQDAGKFYLDGLELKELQDMVAQKMDAIKKAGITTHIPEILKATASEKNPDYARIKACMPLIEIGASIDEIVAFSKIAGEINIGGIDVSEINPKLNREKFMTIAVEVGKCIGNWSEIDICKLSQIMSPEETAESVIGKIEKMKADGITSGFIDMISRTYGLVNPNYKTVLELEKNNHGFKYLERRILSTMKGDPLEILAFIKDLQSKGYNDVKKYPTLWLCGNQADLAIKRYRFIEGNKELLKLGSLDLNKKLAEGTDNDQRDDLRNQQMMYIIENIDSIMNSPPEVQEFSLYILRRTIDSNWKNLEQFIKAPFIPLCIEVYKSLGGDRWVIEKSLQIGRSLYNEGIRILPDKVTLDQKIQKWEKLNNESREIEPYKGRNVIVIAHNQPGQNGKMAFANDIEMGALKTSIGPEGTLTVLRLPPDAKAKDIAKLKEDAAIAFKKTPQPMTFIFLGHGSEEGLWLMDGQVAGDGVVGQVTECISPDELATFMKGRVESYPEPTTLKDREVFILNGCNAYGYAENFYEKNRKQSGRQPVALATEEKGQYNYGISTGDVNTLENSYKVGNEKVNIGMINDFQNDHENSDINIFVPNDEGIEQNVGEAKKAEITLAA